MVCNYCQVRDTVEVDFNVSRHLEFELAAKDWTVLVSLVLVTCLIPCGLIIIISDSLNYNHAVHVYD
jgi:hypothetical protein